MPSDTIATLRRTGFDMSIPPGVWVDDEKTAQGWIDYFLQSYKKNNGLGVDTETTGLDKLRDRVVVCSISDGEYRICFPARLLGLFKQLLENPDIPLDGTNLKFDAHMLANMGVEIVRAGPWRDTMVMSFLRNENNTGRHGLKESTVDHLHRATPHFKEVFGSPIPQRKNKKGIITFPGVSVGDLVRLAFTQPVPVAEPNVPFDGESEASVALWKPYHDYQAALERFQRATDYASLDAYNSTSLRCFFDAALEAVQIAPGFTLKNYFYDTEVPFTKVLWKMERRGITVDKGHLEAQRGPMEAEMASIQAEFGQIWVDEEGKHGLPNLNAVVQVRRIFYDILGKPKVEFTDGGTTGNKQPCVDADVLDGWAGEGDPWAQKLLRFRSIAKIHGTYVEGLEKWLDPNYRIHTSLNQIGAVTMRLSSSEPNLQNIPRVNSDNFKIREAFTHGARKTLIVADYEQLEMRLMAHFSGDQKMIDAIRNGIDLHCLTVSEMYGIPYDDVNNAKKAEKLIKDLKRAEPLTPREEELLFYRQAAKATGFGIIYGIGGPHLAANLTKELHRPLSEREGNELIAKWFSVFPGVKKYIEDTKTWIWQNGFVQTLVGRYRRFGDLKSMSRRDAAASERQGVNSVVQGSASDLAKKAMIIVEDDPVLKGLGADLLLQIHDELMLECPDDPDTVKAVKARVKEIMEHPFSQELVVPLPASCGAGHTWADAK
jgi:DNA polymerase I-like protein with 3'-5' exonuclease and polymerase domains